MTYLKDSQVLPISYPHVIDIPVTRSYEKVSLSNKVQYMVQMCLKDNYDVIIVLGIYWLYGVK